MEHFEVCHQLRENYNLREIMLISIENRCNYVKNRYFWGNYVENRYGVFGCVFHQKYLVSMKTYRQYIKYIQEGSDYRKFQINISSRKRKRTH